MYFSNGNEFLNWRSHNCDECKFDIELDSRGNLVVKCPMENAIARLMLDDPIPGKLEKKYLDEKGNCKLKNVDPIEPDDPRQVKITDLIEEVK